MAASRSKGGSDRRRPSGTRDAVCPDSPLEFGERVVAEAERGHECNQGHSKQRSGSHGASFWVEPGLRGLGASHDSLAGTWRGELAHGALHTIARTIALL